MFQVVVDMARSLDILHQIGAVSSQCLEYAFQHIERFGLVMNGVESCDEVEGLLLNGFVKIAQVGDLELGVLQSLLRGQVARKLNRFLGQVEARKVAVGIKFR